MRVRLLNGPDLGSFGVREPDKYGTATWARLVATCRAAADELGLDVAVRQTDGFGGFGGLGGLGRP